MKTIGASNMLNIAFLFSVLLSACSPFGVGKEETQMMEKLLVGSDFRNNSALLSGEGWLQTFGGSCDTDALGDREYVYVRGADPSYSLTLTYDRECKLQSTSIKKREINEL